jgi:hypothetical protein
MLALLIIIACVGRGRGAQRTSLARASIRSAIFWSVRTTVSILSTSDAKCASTMESFLKSSRAMWSLPG